MKISTAKFVGSFPSVNKFPKGNHIEIAFAGRSNVGKSSLLNFLCERKSLAQISGKPGKTQMINHFLINETWKMIDLPGYGYAKISKKHRESLATMIDGYVLNSPNLALLMVLVDSRIPPQKLDLDFMCRLGEAGVPFAVCFTKCDKLDADHEKRISDYETELLRYWEELPTIFQTSSKKKRGRDDVLDFLETVTEA
jgi:GTP-binding protein